MRVLASLVLLGALATAFAACNDDASSPTPTQALRSATATGTAAGARTTATVAVTTPTASAPEPTLPASSTSPAIVATATLAPGRKFELAPIDGAEIVVRDAEPPEYAVHVTSGLPSGCAQFADATAARAGDEITITVRNTVPSDPQIACTEIYGTHETTVELGVDFARGTTYHVGVNERTVEFTAQ